MNYSLRLAVDHSIVAFLRIRGNIIIRASSIDTTVVRPVTGGI